MRDGHQKEIYSHAWVTTGADKVYKFIISRTTAPNDASNECLSLLYLFVNFICKCSLCLVLFPMKELLSRFWCYASTSFLLVEQISIVKFSILSPPSTLWLLMPCRKLARHIYPHILSSQFLEARWLFIFVSAACYLRLYTSSSIFISYGKCRRQEYIILIGCLRRACLLLRPPDQQLSIFIESRKGGMISMTIIPRHGIFIGALIIDGFQHLIRWRSRLSLILLILYAWYHAANSSTRIHIHCEIKISFWLSFTIVFPFVWCCTLLWLISVTAYYHGTTSYSFQRASSCYFFSLILFRLSLTCI